jgi:biotin carboxyl carrier protein
MIEAFVEAFQFPLQVQGQQVRVGDEPLAIDVKRINERLYHVIYQNQSYDVFIQRIDPEAREATISINGKRSTVRLQTRIEKLLKELGLEAAMTKKLDKLKAPMPGMIHSLKITEGQTVKKGDPLLILEAMKMENVIKSPGDGTVIQIHVDEKASVEKNALLISFG